MVDSNLRHLTWCPCDISLTLYRNIRLTLIDYDLIITIYGNITIGNINGLYRRSNQVFLIRVLNQRFSEENKLWY